MAGWGKADPTERGATAGASRKVWNAIGAGFFRALAKHLSDALAADCVYVGEVSHRPAESVQTLAVFKDGAAGDDFEYALAGTASADAFEHGTYVCQSGARRSFPSDLTLEQQDAEAFAGKGLFGSAGESLGLIVALWRHPIGDSASAVAMLRAFASRTAAELERKQAEDNLRESEQRYRAFVSASTDAMWRIEFEEPIPIDLPEDEQLERIYRLGYLAECNDAAARMMGAAGASDLSGARLSSFVPRTDAHLDELRTVIRAGYKATIYNAQLVGRGGTACCIRTYLGIVENGTLLRVWGTTRDVADLKKAELEWRASERRFRQLLESIRMAAVMLNPEGKVTFCNDYLLGLTGWPKDELLGKDWFETMVPEEDRGPVKAAFSEFLGGSEAHYRFEGPLLKRDGTRLLIDWDRALLRDAEGKVTGTASLGRDVTYQRALEARLNEARRLESVGKFAGGIAHDFNNLLTIIRGYAEILLEEHESGPLHEAAEEVIRASEQGAALTRQLLSFSRNQPMKPRLLKLNDVITENENMLRRLLGDKIELTLDLDPAPRTVLADPGQIHQVLVNLAMNARDAMPEGGKLTVTSGTIEVGESCPAGMPDARPGSYVTLAVADTGTGLTEEVLAHLFEPFFTTKRGRGTGLGLPSVYGIVRQSGGYIAVDSAPGKGATFRVLLPAVPEGGPEPQGDSAPAARGGPETILLVDDEPALRGLAARALRASGYEVVEAGTGTEALSAAEGYSKRIDLLLTDFAMPNMDGSELAKRLKAARPDLKVLYMSGYTEILPGDAYIQKPFTTRALAEKVRAVLGPGNK